jgi:hypothetical protein
VGVTTANRRIPTLAQCVERVVHAGWLSPRLFVDGYTPIPEQCQHLPVTIRDAAVGAWPNYYLSLVELVMRNPIADAYLLIQDDAVMCRDSTLRAYLESALWPNGRPGIASLYCSSAYTGSRPGWYRQRRVWRWGALAFVFSRRAAHRFLRNRYVISHRRLPEPNGCANIDGVVGRWSNRWRVPLYYPTPSLVQHIGEASTLWRRARAEGTRQADWFAVDSSNLR